MIVLLDNYDSFVHNLARYVCLSDEKPANVRVIRSDAITIQELKSINPRAIIMSPGPGKPDSAGVCINAAQQLNAPILGVCLGHQAIAQAYGGEITKSADPMHGKSSQITHDKSALFKGIPSPFMAGRYHSLIAKTPSPLIDCAWSEKKESMAFYHPHKPIWGVQFHPESLLTPDGLKIIQNFLVLADKFQANPCQ